MKQSKKLVLLVGAIGLVAVFIYGYSNYGLEFGKFFAAEPGSSVIQCSPAQQSVGSGGAVYFTAIISTPTPTPTPTIKPSPIVMPPTRNRTTKVTAPAPSPTISPKPTVTPPIVWTAETGFPSSGTGIRFKTIFTNTGPSSVTKKVLVQYGKEQATCYVTVAPLPTPTPVPTGTPLGVPATTQSALPSTVLQNGNVVLARYSIASSGERTWLKRIAFSINKTAPISLNNGFRIFEDGVDISSFATYTADPGILPGYTSTRIVYTFTNERSLLPGHLYELRATVSGVSGTMMSIRTDVLNGSGTGEYQRMTYTGGLENPNPAVSLVWTDRSAPYHSYTTLDWYSDRNVRVLPMTWAVWTQ